MELTTIGIDLAKNVFQVYGCNKNGTPLFNKPLSRKKLLPFLAKQPKCLIGMEACGGSNYWAREISKLGHEVKIMPAQYVRPYVKGNKNDAQDAEGICEAVTRKNMRFVPQKTVNQMDLQAMHRVRDMYRKHRTAISNQMRGLLLENGFAIPKGAWKVEDSVVKIVANADGRLTDLFCALLLDQLQMYRETTARLNDITLQLTKMSRQNPDCKRLQTIPGIGPITASLMVASVGDFHTFKKGRQLSAWLGLVPRQFSTGGKARLGKISKRGNRSLRTLLILGAKTVVRVADRKTDPYSLWIQRLIAKRGANVAAVAVANKNARIIWALMTKQEVYQQPGEAIFCEG